MVTVFYCRWELHWLFHGYTAGVAFGVMGALQLGSAALSAAVIGKVSGYIPWVIAVLLAAYCLVSFIIYIRRANYFMTFGDNRKPN